MSSPLKYRNVFSFICLLLIVAAVQSCDIKEPTAPNWDVSLNVPIAKKNYNLLEIIEDKSSSFQHYNEGANKNLIFYTDIQQVEKITLGDNLKPDPSTGLSSGANGAISISPDSVISDIDYSWITPPVSPGMQLALPPVPETNVSGNFTIADQFDVIRIESGYIDISITNYFPSPVKITLRNLILRNSGTDEIIAQVTTPTEILSLQTVSINSLSITPGIRIKNQLTLESKISATGSNGQQITLPANSLRIKTKYRGLMVSEYQGKLKPTVLERRRSAIALNVKDIQNKLKFQQINLKNPKIELWFRSTANVEFNIDGTLEARSLYGQRSVMTLSSRTLNKILISKTDTLIIVNSDSLSNFFKKFSSFPDSLIVFAGGTVNPNNKSITINASDQLTVTSKMEFPLELGLSGGEFYDSVKVDLSNDDRDQIKDVNSLSASLQVTNGIPAALSFTGRLYDQANNFLTYFPPKYQDQDTVVSVSGAQVDANGNVISNAVQNITVKSLKSEIDKISKAYYMRIKVKFNTSGTGNQPVRFKTDNILKFLASGSAGYHVNPKGEQK